MYITILNLWMWKNLKFQEQQQNKTKQKQRKTFDRHIKKKKKDRLVVLKYAHKFIRAAVSRGGISFLAPECGLESVTCF